MGRLSYERRGGGFTVLFTLFMWFLLSVVPAAILIYVAVHFIQKFW